MEATQLMLQMTDRAADLLRIIFRPQAGSGPDGTGEASPRQ
jgi:hypothetical protein